MWLKYLKFNTCNRKENVQGSECWSEAFSPDPYNYIFLSLHFFFFFPIKNCIQTVIKDVLGHDTSEFQPGTGKTQEMHKYVSCLVI